EGTGLHTDRWREEGPWLLLLVLPLAALAFRRGYLVAVVLVFLVFPERAYPFDWDALWSNSNQRASQALEDGNPEHAAELFTDPQWKATAQYRAEQFDQAVTSLENIETPEALYNKGNALARGGRFPDAIEAYETALGLDDTHEDARHNRDLIEEFLEQQQRQQDGQGDESDDEQQSSQESEDQQGDQQQQDSASADASAGNERPDQQDGQEETQGDQDEVQQAQSNPDQRSTDSRDQTVADAREDLESQQAYEQWLRRIPDDPGGLLRRKFLHQYQQRPQQPAENILW
ncbi:MAG TPA: tetratricopeptide repeat protein, partial [Nitrospirales bacterium]|nr:tetratricopeptide repeat protein [Nitrospirales bacterium]